MAKEVLIYGPIYSYSAELFINAINEVPDGEDLVVRINTGGGETAAGWSMVAKFAEFKGNKSVKIDGQAMSFGAIFPLYADNVEALDVSEFLIHRAAYPSWYEKEYMTEDQKASLIETNKNVEKALRAKIDVEQFEKITGKKIKDIFSMDSRLDVRFTASQAKKIGLVSKVNTITPSRKAELEALAKSSVLDSVGKGVGIAALIFEPSASNEQSVSINQNQNKKAMSIDQFKIEHPEAYAAIVKIGVTQERDRVGSWMKFNDVDPAAVSAGITSGENISQTAMADFAVKVYAKQNLAALGSDNAPDLETKKAAEAAAKEAADKKALEDAKNPLASFEAEVLSHLKIGKKD